LLFTAFCNDSIGNDAFLEAVSKSASKLPRTVTSGRELENSVSTLPGMRRRKRVADAGDMFNAHLKADTRDQFKKRSRRRPIRRARD